jgi:hypothetical protein
MHNKTLIKNDENDDILVSAEKLDKSYSLERLSSDSEDSWFEFRTILMNHYINSRSKKSPDSPHFSRLSPSMLESDSHYFSGSAPGSYFFAAQRKSSKVIQQDDLWYFHNTAIKVPKNCYMYVISQSGSLYITADAFFHSQIKAGKPVRTAGWLKYDETDSQEIKLCIDNSSGHYRPSLEQFLCGLESCYFKGNLPQKFEIELNPNTPIDLHEDRKFWQEALHEVHQATADIKGHTCQPIEIQFFDDTLQCTNKKGQQIHIYRDKLHDDFMFTMSPR